MQLVELLKVFWVSLAASAVVAWPIYRWLKSTVKQKIDPHLESHQVKQGTPTMGGLIILAGSVAGLVTALVTTNQQPYVGGEAQLAFKQHFAPLLILVLGFGLIGFVDDFVVPRMYDKKRGLGWKQKLILEVVLAGLAMAAAYPTESSAAPFLLGGFLILFFSNAYNFSDGLDGLAGSLWLALAVGIFFIASSPSGVSAQVGATAVAGGVVAFLFLNAPPAKIFMGDVGSLPLGAVLGFCVSTVIWPHRVLGYSTETRLDVLVPMLIISLVMIAELVPVPLQVAYFKLTKGKRLFPRTPIHHAFEVKGWKETKIVWTFALVQLLLSLAAVTVYLLQSSATR